MMTGHKIDSTAGDVLDYKYVRIARDQGLRLCTNDFETIAKDKGR